MDWAAAANEWQPGRQADRQGRVQTGVAGLRCGALRVLLARGAGAGLVVETKRWVDGHQHWQRPGSQSQGSAVRDVFKGAEPLQAASKRLRALTLHMHWPSLAHASPPVSPVSPVPVSAACKEQPEAAPSSVLGNRPRALGP
jgi:hypothetical protein